MDTVIIEDDQINEESFSVLSPQGNVSPIRDTTPNTLVLQQTKDYPKEG